MYRIVVGSTYMYTYESVVLIHSNNSILTIKFHEFWLGDLLDTERVPGSIHVSNAT